MSEGSSNEEGWGTKAWRSLVNLAKRPQLRGADAEAMKRLTREVEIGNDLTRMTGNNVDMLTDAHGNNSGFVRSGPSPRGGTKGQPKPGGHA